jgi:hypothetical protein
MRAIKPLASLVVKTGAKLAIKREFKTVIVQRISSAGTA